MFIALALFNDARLRRSEILMFFKYRAPPERHSHEGCGSTNKGLLTEQAVLTILVNITS